MRLHKIFLAICALPLLCCIWPITISLIRGILLASWLQVTDSEIAVQLSAAERREFQMNRWHSIDPVEPYMVPQLWDTEWQNQLGMLRIPPFDTAMSYGAPDHLSALPGVPCQWVYLPESGGLEDPWNSAFDSLMQLHYINQPEYFFNVMLPDTSPLLEKVWHVRRPAMVYFKVDTTSHEPFKPVDMPGYEYLGLSRPPVEVYVAELPLLEQVSKRPLSHLDQLSLLTNGTIDPTILPTWIFMRQALQTYGRQYEVWQKDSLVLSSIERIDSWLDTYAAILNSRALYKYLITHTTNGPLLVFAWYNHVVWPYVDSFLGHPSSQRPLYIAVHPDPHEHANDTT